MGCALPAAFFSAGRRNPSIPGRTRHSRHAASLFRRIPRRPAGPAARLVFSGQFACAPRMVPAPAHRHRRLGFPADAQMGKPAPDPTGQLCLRDLSIPRFRDQRRPYPADARRHSFPDGDLPALHVPRHRHSDSGRNRAPAIPAVVHPIPGQEDAPSQHPQGITGRRKRRLHPCIVAPQAR